MADALPPEYQAALEEALRKQRLAQMLSERAMNPTMPNQGRVASRISPLAGIANVLGGVAGGYLGNQAQGEAAGVRQRYSADEQQAVKDFQAGGDPKAGFGSQFSTVRKMAEELQKRQDKQRETGAGIISTAGDAKNALGVLGGSTDMSTWLPPELKQPEFKEVNLGGKTYPGTINYDAKGQGRATLGATGNTVSVDARQAGKEGEMVLDHLKGELKTRSEKAATAKNVLASTGFAVDALEQGAKAGGGETAKQFIRKAAQAIGINLPATGETEQLSMALIQGVVDQASKLRPASDTDILMLKEMAGTISTDPSALVKTLAFANSIAMKDLQGYNDYAEENRKSKDPNIQAMFSGATSGHEVPGQLVGPIPYQMEVARQLQRQGYDISRLRDPSGKPFDPNSKFDIDPTGGFPGVAKTKPAPAPRSKAEVLSEIKALKKELGIK